MKKDIHYNYDLQTWVVNGRFERCGHTDKCNCYGRIHEGEVEDK